MVGETTIVGIEAFRKRVDVARQGDMVGLMLRGVSREQVHAGDIVVVRQVGEWRTAPASYQAMPTVWGGCMRVTGFWHAMGAGSVSEHTVNFAVARPGARYGAG